tara:strand:- start:1601 stop:2008 length:408 start_codon:yes stop_codon:yes gene_type:complete
MIKLKDILLEGAMSRQEVMAIVKKVYPKIVRALGRARKGTPRVSAHSSIYARLSGVEGMMGTANPHAEYDFHSNEIYLYLPRMTSVEQIIRSLLHEYTHAKQDPKKMEMYREKGYANNPYEREAGRAELMWKRFA